MIEHQFDLFGNAKRGDNHHQLDLFVTTLLVLYKQGLYDIVLDHHRVNRKSIDARDGKSPSRYARLVECIKTNIMDV